MSLRDEYFARSKFVIMDKTTMPDGYGGVITKWVDGAEIEATVDEIITTGAEIAGALTEKKQYVVFTKKNVVLMQGDVIKRMTDGRTFVITSDAENETPSSSSLNMRRCEAEPIVLKDSN